MLLDEERVAAQNNAIYLSHELDPKENTYQTLVSDGRPYPSGNTSMLVEPKRTEPLITKAYDAFRKHKSLNKVADNLVPTEEYIDE